MVLPVGNITICESRGGPSFSAREYLHSQVNDTASAAIQGDYLQSSFDNTTRVLSFVVHACVQGLFCSPRPKLRSRSRLNGNVQMMSGRRVHSIVIIKNPFLY